MQYIQAEKKKFCIQIKWSYLYVTRNMDYAGISFGRSWRIMNAQKNSLEFSLWMKWYGYQQGPDFDDVIFLSLRVDDAIIDLGYRAQSPKIVIL